jgi:hypothetical protein
MPTITALVFHFVIVCNPMSMWGCGLPYGGLYDGWVDQGPWFTWQDCQDAKHQAAWRGVSECYAHLIDTTPRHVIVYPR